MYNLKHILVLTYTWCVALTMAQEQSWAQHSYEVSEAFTNLQVALDPEGSVWLTADDITASIVQINATQQYAATLGAVLAYPDWYCQAGVFSRAVEIMTKNFTDVITQAGYMKEQVEDDLNRTFGVCFDGYKDASDTIYGAANLLSAFIADREN